MAYRIDNIPVDPETNQPNHIHGHNICHMELRTYIPQSYSLQDRREAPAHRHEAPVIFIVFQSVSSALAALIRHGGLNASRSSGYATAGIGTKPPSSSLSFNRSHPRSLHSYAYAMEA